MLAALGAALGPVADLAKGWLANRREQQKARQATAMAVENRKRELAEAKGEHDAAWELGVLGQPDRLMRRTLALLLLSPIVITVVAPARGREVWAALAIVPTEYWAIVGVVFGFYFAAKNAPILFGQLKQAFARMKRPPPETAALPAPTK